MKPARRRKLLATSFVTTLGVLAGCAGQREDPVTTIAVSVTPPTAAATVTGQPSASVATAPTGAPVVRPASFAGEIRLTSSGRCEWTGERELPDCPDNMACNPPPPFVMTVPCPTNGRKLPAPTRIHRDGERCYFHAPWGEMSCPPDATCNPPPPRFVDVACPDSRHD